ncbi:MAG: TetR/AcrR family transcriptional regulator [Thalassobaculaceae bacterium]|nr:TetR/AcrR family transcriptional regulator [Thalassobaculaceae bacterium]
MDQGTRNVRRRDPVATRAGLLEAATLEFARYGFDGARVDRIVRSAGCNTRMLYHYFDNKEKLYLQVLEATYHDIREKEQQLDLATLAPRDALLRLTRFTWDHFRANQIFIDLTRNENLTGGQFIRQSAAIAEMSSPLISMIEDTIGRGLILADFRHEVDPLQLYVSIVALSSHHLSNAHTLSAVFKTDLTAPDWLEARYAHVETLVLRMVGAQDP